MTQGGPLDATLSVAFQAYSQFSFGNYAYTAAMAFILFIAIGDVDLRPVPALPAGNLIGGAQVTTTAQTPPATPAGRTPRRTRSERGGTWITLALVIGLLIMVVPFIWMLLGSFKPTSELRQVPPTWWPVQGTFENFTDLFSRQNFGRFFFNSARRRDCRHDRQPALLFDAGLRPCQAGVPGKADPVPGGPGDAHGAGRRDLHAAVHRGEQPGPGEHPRRPDPALPGRRIRRVPHAPVHHGHSGRAARCRARRRRGRVLHLLADRSAALRRAAGDARHPDLPRQLE